MSEKARINPAFVESTCDKYLNRLMRQEKQNSNKKVDHQQRRSTTKTTKSAMDQHSPPVKDKQQTNKRTSCCKCSCAGVERVVVETGHPPQQTWKDLLLANNLNYIDPIQTLGCLFKELKFKLQTVFVGDNEITEMITDIQHVLKRIPLEIITAMNQQLTTGTDRYNFNRKSVKMSERSCQTTPNLNEDDTERIRRIMKESSLKLETTCRQLELLCTNLQTENSLIETQLKNERDNVKSLERKVQSLEQDLQHVNQSKVKQLEDENERLRNQLQTLSTADRTDKSKRLYLQQMIEELEKRKSLKDQRYSQLNYDLTVSNLEKEKYSTMLTIRDREIKELRDEMLKLQQEINQNFAKLNRDMVALAPNFQDLSQTKESLFVGDSISSITSDYSVNSAKKSTVHSE